MSRDIAIFREITEPRERLSGRRTFRAENQNEKLIVSIVSEIDVSPMGDNTEFRADPNGPSNREAADTLVGLASQLLGQPIGSRLSV